MECLEQSNYKEALRHRLQDEPPGALAGFVRASATTSARGYEGWGVDHREEEVGVLIAAEDRWVIQHSPRSARVPELPSQLRRPRSSRTADTSSKDGPKEEALPPQLRSRDIAALAREAAARHGAELAAPRRRMAPDRQADRQRDRQKDRQTDRQTERQTDRQTERQTDR